MRLSMVTIYKYESLFELQRTIDSLESQSIKVDELIFVLNSCPEKYVNKAQSCANIKSIKIIHNADKNLYDAMNIGVKTSSMEYILFLNGGDEMFSHTSLKKIKDIIKSKKDVYLFRTLQVFKDNFFIRPGINNLNQLRKFPAHQGFVTKTNIHKKYLYDYELYPIGADQYLMWKILSDFDYFISEEISAKFNLGGISNSPSFKTISIRFKEKGIIRALKELFKAISLSIIGPKNYFILINFLSGNEKLHK